MPEVNEILVNGREVDDERIEVPNDETVVVSANDYNMEKMVPRINGDWVGPDGNDWKDDDGEELTTVSFNPKECGFSGAVHVQFRATDNDWDSWTANSVTLVLNDGCECTCGGCVHESH